MKDKVQSNDVCTTLGGATIQHPFSIQSASIGTSRRSGGWKYIFSFLLVLAMSIGQMWAIGNSATTTFTCGTTTPGFNYVYTFDKVSSNTDTIIFSGAMLYGSSATYAYTNSTSSRTSSDSSFPATLYNEASGGSATNGKGIYSSGTGTNCNRLNMNNTTKDLYIKVTNCVAVKISANSYDESNPMVLKAYLPSDLTTPVKLANTEANNAISTAVVTGLTASNTYIIEIKNGSSQTGRLYEVALIYPHASSCTAPTTTFANGAYTVGGSALALSSLISNNNSDGAISYVVKTDGGTSASISEGSFTASTAGTATITATQAADATKGKCEKIIDFNVVVTSSSAGPVDPTITFNDGAYTIGGSALDLSTLIASSNSSGAITYEVKTDNGTNASISGNNFTAENEGTCVVTASQAAVTGTYNAKTVDFNVVVSAAAPAPTPCATLTPATSGDSPTAIGQEALLQAGSTGGKIVFVSYKTGNNNTIDQSFTYTSRGLQLNKGGDDKIRVELNHLIQEGTIITVNMDWTRSDDKASGLVLRTGDDATSVKTMTMVNPSGAFSDYYEVQSTDTKLIGSNSFILARSNSVGLKSVTVSNCGAELHALTSAVSVEGKATVTLSKSMVAAGGTATATYSDIDAAYEFDEWEISGTGATLSSTSTNPTTITMGSADATITLKLKAVAVKHTVTYYDNTTVLGSEEINDGGNPTGAGLAPRKLGYTFAGWSTTNGGAAVALNTISVAANMPLYAVWNAVNCATKSGTIYTMSIAVAPLANCTITSTTGTHDLYQYEGVSGGEAILGNKGTSNNCILQTNKTVLLKDDNSYIKLDFDCPLKEGDKIVYSVGSNNPVLSTGNSKPSTPLATLDRTKTEFVIPAENGLIDAQTIYIWKGGGNTTVTYINIVRPAKYAVTFNMHDHGDAVPAQSIVEGGKVTEPATTDITGWDFDGWYKESTFENEWDFATDVVNAATELHAKWTVHVAKYTVKYMDGETELDNEEVVVGENPVGIANPTKALFTFANWKNGDDVVNPTELSGTANQVITLQAQWTKVFAQDINVEDYAYNTGTDKTAFLAWLTSKGYNYDNLNALDNTTNNNGAYAGMKANSKDAYYEFRVAANKRVTIKLGYMAAAAKMYINGVENTTQALTGGSTSSGNANYAEWTYDVTAESIFKLQMNSTSTCVLKAITIGEPPAQSDDATLKSLKVAGTLIAGFSPAVTSYYVEMPYGTAKADLPLVTVEVNEEHAGAVVQDAKDRLDDTRATIAVTAENGTTVNYYYVYFYNAPKLGVELIKATHNGTASGATVTGYIGGTVDKLTQNGGKLGSDDPHHYFGIQLASGKFQAGDMLVIKASALNGGNAATLYSDKGVTAISTNGSFDATTKMYIYTLTAETEKIYLYRQSSACNPNVEYMAVYRYMAPFIESFEIEGIGALTINGTNITAEVAQEFDVTALTPTIKYWANGEAQINKTGVQNFTNPVKYTVSSQYAEDATGAYAPVEYTVTITKVVPSATPSITTQPQGANYIEGASIAELSVVAEASDEGTLTYQWYLGADAIDGATEATYTPTVSAIGSYSYTCVVTNKKGDKPAASAISDAAVLVIAEDPACKAVGYGTSRALATTTEVVLDATTGLKHVSSKSAVEENRKIKDVSNIDGIKLDGGAYYDIYTTEKNIGSVDVSLTSNSNGTNRKFAVIFCSTAAFDASKILGIVEQTGGAGDEVQVINTPEVPLGTKLVRVMRYYKDANNNEYGEGSSSWIYYARVCLIEPAQEVTASVTAEPASANYCPSDAVAELSYTLSIEEGASAAYQWYKGTDAIDGATDAVYMPAETGVYTCKANVTKTGRLSKQLTSAEATVNFYAATAITAYADAVGDVDAAKTVSVTAEGTNLSYKWQACDANGIVTDETILGTNASMNVTIAADIKYYLVTVTGECGGAQTQVVKAAEWHEVAPANVTGSRTWDWTTAGMGEIETESGSVEYLMANVSSKVPNTEAFRSDMLYITGNYANRGSSNKFFQGTQIRFYTEVPGQVSLECRAIHEHVKITINENVIEAERGGSMTPATTPFTVPSGWVTIVFDNISTGQYADEPARVQKLIFTAASDLDPAEADYTRDVTEGRYGTICLPNGGVMVGAAIFEIAYMDYQNNKPYKIYFDEVLNGEMVAGRPYIFLPNENATQLGVYYTDAADAEAGNYRGLYGSYTKIELTPNDGNYILKNNQYYYVNSSNVWCAENRAYIKLAEVPDFDSGKPAYSRRRVALGVQSEQVATGMDELNAGETPVKVIIDGQMYIFRGEKMYDATGRLVK